MRGETNALAFAHPGRDAHLIGVGAVGLAAVPGPLAVSISLGGYFMSALWGVPGAFFWLVKREERP